MPDGYKKGCREFPTAHDPSECGRRRVKRRNFKGVLGQTRPPCLRVYANETVAVAQLWKIRIIIPPAYWVILSMPMVWFEGGSSAVHASEHDQERGYSAAGWVAFAWGTIVYSVAVK